MPRSADEPNPLRPNQFHFGLGGLVLYSAVLVVAGAGVVAFVIGRNPPPGARPDFDIPSLDEESDSLTLRKGAWGELLVRNIRLERPRDLVEAETAAARPERWVFRNSAPDLVRALLVAGGLSPAEVGREFAGNRVEVENADAVALPTPEFLLSLRPEVRRDLYVSLRGRGVYQTIDYPYIFPGDGIESVCSDRRLVPADAEVLRKLSYRVGDATWFSDYDALLGMIPTPQRRIAMALAISRQPAVLVRLCVRPDTDIDKVAAYWGHMENVHFNNIHPLLESLRDQPQGATLSIVHLLPPFARERLYTYPNRGPGDPGGNCHWTCFNFGNLKADDRFADTAYAAKYVDENYSQVGSPGMYGDIVLLVNDRQELQHSAVFLADDLVFTKYGFNDRQPWMIVHIRDMLAAYPGFKPVYMRRMTD